MNIRNIRASFISPAQSAESIILFDGWKCFAGSSTQYHVLVLEHPIRRAIEIIVYNEQLNIEAPRLYLEQNILTASLSQESDVQEKFNDIRQMLVRQKQKIQILQFINSRIVIPTFEVKEEFACILVPKEGDSLDLFEEQNLFRKPRDLVAFETNRLKNESFQETGFSHALIRWRKECNAMEAANAKSSAYQIIARSAIDGFKRQSGHSESTENLKNTTAHDHWIRGLRKVQTRNYVKHVQDRLETINSHKVNSAPMFRNQVTSSPSKLQCVDVSVDTKLPSPKTSPPSNYENFFEVLNRHQSEMPLTIQSADRAAYLEELVASVIGLFRSNLEQVQRSNSFCQKYSCARQRWIHAVRKIATRNYTAQLRKRLERSPSGKMLLKTEMNTLTNEVAQLSNTEEIKPKFVLSVSDMARMRQVEVLLGSEWMNSEKDFYSRLHDLHEEIASLTMQNRRSAYLQGLTAIVVSSFTFHLERIKRSNSDREQLSRWRCLWIKSIEKVISRNRTAKIRKRLQSSSCGRDMLNAKQRIRDLQNVRTAFQQKGSRRHNRRDDIELRDLPKGYSTGAVDSSRPSTAMVGNSDSTPLRGIEKAFSSDDAGQKRTPRRSLPGRLQRQVGLTKVAVLNNSSLDRRAPALKDLNVNSDGERSGEKQTTLHSKSLRNATLSRGNSDDQSAVLVKSMSSNMASGHSSSGTNTPRSSSPQKSTSRSRTNSHQSSLFHRLVDPFSRNKTQQGNEKTNADKHSDSPSRPRLSLNSSNGGTDTDRESFDSKDCGGGGLYLPLSNSLDTIDLNNDKQGEQGLASSSSSTARVSPSLYQRLVNNSGPQRTRTFSENSDIIEDHEEGDSVAPMKMSAKGGKGNGQLVKQFSRIVPINITADLDNERVLKTRTTSSNSNTGFGVACDSSSGSFYQTDQGCLSVSNDNFDLNALSTARSQPRLLQHQQQLQWMKQKPPSSPHSPQISPQGQQHYLQMPRGFPSLHLNTDASRSNSFICDVANVDTATVCIDSPYAVSDLISPDYRHHMQPPSPLKEGSSGRIPRSPERKMMSPASPCNPRLLNSSYAVQQQQQIRTQMPSSPHTVGMSRSNSQSKKYDTLGDIAKKYNIDPSNKDADVAVPRYAQSTIKSMIRGSRLQPQSQQLQQQQQQQSSQSVAEK